MDYLLCSILYSFVLVNASIEKDDSEVNCKIWSQSIPDAAGEYPCGVDKIGVVKCDENNNNLKIHACYCIYWDQDTKKSVVGSCILSCFYSSIERYSISNGTLFNEDACSPSVLHQVISMGSHLHCSAYYHHSCNKYLMVCLMLGVVQLFFVAITSISFL